MKMALEGIQKTGIKGEKVEAVIYDTRGENAEAINLTRKLIFNDKVLAIVGPFFSAGVLRSDIPDCRFRARHRSSPPRPPNLASRPRIVHGRSATLCLPIR